MKKSIKGLTFGVIAFTLFFGIGMVEAQETQRSIVNIAGDLYRFRNNNHYSVFLVTKNGVIATDPINMEAARYLKSEIRKRFDLPVKYVIYSHHHADHISGGAVFNDTAVFVAHDLTKRAIIASQRPAQGLPPRLAAMDSDGSGSIERKEAKGRFQANFDQVDSDGDGSVTVTELAARRGGGNIVPPTLTFSDRMTVELGGKRVELTYVGRNHSDNSIVMRFPEEKTLFVVDFVTVKRLPFGNLRESYLPDWIDSLKRVEQMEFHILTPGHGVLGVKADVADNRAYLEDLSEAVLKLSSEGKTLEQMKLLIKLEDYKAWGQYDAWLQQNIEGVYNLLVRKAAQYKGG